MGRSRKLSPTTEQERSLQNNLNKPETIKIFEIEPRTLVHMFATEVRRLIEENPTGMENNDSWDPKRARESESN